MKREIMTDLGYDSAEIEHVVAAIKVAETAICQDAEIVAAVTRADGEKAKEMGAHNYVLARNGMHELTFSRNDMDYWRKYYSDRGIERTAVFVGSAHPPNMSGFRTMISTAMGFLPAGCAVVLAGSVGDNIMNNLQSDSIADITAHRRLISVGRLPVERLNALILSSDAILLPITEGGGSNLKTAEAILSQKPIVATSKALRSFEEYASFPTMHVADSADEYRGTIRDVMMADRPVLTDDQQALTKQMLWENCLKDMVEAVKAL